MKRPTVQRPASYTLAWHWPSRPAETLGSSHHPNTAMADVFMHAERLLQDGYGVTITPPATARHQSVPVDVVDLEILR